MKLSGSPVNWFRQWTNSMWLAYGSGVVESPLQCTKREEVFCKYH